MKTARDTKRQRARAATRCPRVAIAGYTNAGKSSLLNRLTGAGRAGRGRAVRHPRPDRAPGARRPTAASYTLTDTVGFVRHLPHQLVEAFRSTLEEVADADLILHVVDGSRRRPRGPARRGARGARRGRRDARARDRRHQQGRRRRPDRARPAAPRASRTASWCRRAPARASTSCWPRSRATLPPPERRGRGRCVPYDRGDLVARVHRDGRGAQAEHARRGHPAAGARHARPGRAPGPVRPRPGG